MTNPVDQNIVDQDKINMFKRAPELGPRILFFSGGTALRRTSRALINYTHNSIHLITPFDSGGSSAVLRDAFHMPAVGDIRNRLMALADLSFKGNLQVFELFAYRLPKHLDQDVLREELATMAAGTHSMVACIPDPMRTIIRHHFSDFIERMPADFNLRGASIGNIVLTSGYLSNNKQMAPVIYIFTKLAKVRGVVRPTVNKDMHLAVKTADGTTIVGQHNITGKEVAPLDSPIEDIWLTESLDSDAPTSTTIRCKIKDRIQEADLICYPQGSFYSSVIANLMPEGVGRAVAKNSCPKVYVPNTGCDPEAKELSVADQVRLLREYLIASGAPTEASTLDYVILDSQNGDYQAGIEADKIPQGATIIDTPLFTDASGTAHDPQLLIEALLSLA